MIFLSLILPVHNEEGIIDKVVAEVIETLRKLKISYEILLIENGSTDNSLEVIKGLSKKYNHVRWLISPKGYGNAVLKGLGYAKGKFVSYMPSDGQIDLSVFPRLIKNAGKYDLVKVKRVTRENFARTFLSLAFDLVIFLLFRAKLLDVNGSPRIFLRNELKQLKLQAKDSFIDAEFTIKISKLKWTVLEFPIKNIERYGGKSTRSLKTYLEFIKNILNYRFSDKISKWYKSIEN